VPAVPERVWTLVSDPERLPEWWPNVQRVEDASRGAWTAVLGSSKGKTLRADYTLLDSDHPRLLRWRHEVEESPFERILRDSVTAVELEPAEAGSTRVRISTRLTPRGFSRLGGLQLSRATRRILDGALASLERHAEDWRRS
jgi:uncharacterized protein YndB with AHSA1/START domain